jgi:cytochrome c nitrite reductase small subunit
MKVLRFLIPPPEWRIPVVILLGAMCGFIIYLSIESKATSYLSDDPKTCVNCHVMTPEYTTWSNSSHKEVAVCNDCHVPQDNPIKKYWFKAKDGMYHSYVFTSRTEPQVIQMKEEGQEVVQNNCIRCHQNHVGTSHLGKSVKNHKKLMTEQKCWDCHREVPHGRVHSLSAVKYYGKITEEHQETVPNWLIKHFSKNSNTK